jgi:hypothetical protein
VSPPSQTAAPHPEERHLYGGHSDLSIYTQHDLDQAAFRWGSVLRHRDRPGSGSTCRWRFRVCPFGDADARAVARTPDEFVSGPGRDGCYGVLFGTRVERASPPTRSASFPSSPPSSASSSLVRCDPTCSSMPRRWMRPAPLNTSSPRAVSMT